MKPRCGSTAEHRTARWLQQVASNGQDVARNNSVLGLLCCSAKSKSSVGLAALAMALGDAAQDLVRVLGPIPELSRIWRGLAHPDGRHTRRVAAPVDFMVEAIDTLWPITTG